MPIQVKWYDAEQTIVAYELGEQWSWDELYQAFRVARQMVDSVPHRVDAIMNVLQTKQLPNGAIGHVKSLGASPQTNFGVGVVVSSSLFVKTIFQIIGKLYPELGDRYVVAPTEAQALALIAEARKSHPLNAQR